MTPQEAICYIENQRWSGTRLGLDRTRELLAKLDHPERHLRFVHVAGSNGKGSTCAMLASILRAAGYHTGLYISPPIDDFCERIQLDGENIPGDDLARLTARVRAAAEAMDDHPSQFELITAIGMLYYVERQADIVVLEVGMGGALDSTNAIDAPEVAVITNIGLEHTEYLGNTLEEIAETKAGIIKPGCTVVCYDGAPAVTDVVARVCRAQGVPMRLASFERISVVSSGLAGQEFRWNHNNYHLSLLGSYQLHNAAVVLETVAALRDRGWQIPETAVQTGLANVQWPARLEVLQRDPLVILDGGHNPQCAEALAASLRELLPGRKVVFLFGVLADKNVHDMIEAVLPLAQEFLCLAPDSERALPAQALADGLVLQGAKATAYDDAAAGLDAAIAAAGPDGVVVICGSLYLARRIRRLERYGRPV